MHDLTHLRHRRPIRHSTVLLVGLAVAAALHAKEIRAEDCAQATSDDGTEITRLLGHEYVDAIFVNRDESAVRRGVHEDFRLFVLTDAGLLVVTLDEWLERLGLDGTPSSRRYEHRVTLLACRQDAALARVDLWEDGRHRYVDFLSLYRFPDGWRIVSKTYQSPEQP